MTNNSIFKATSDEEIVLCYPTIRQLRPHLTDEKEFLKRIRRQMARGYQLIYLKEGKEAKAAAGFRLLETLSWGKVLYVDDLITCSSARKKGYATQLLKWLEAKAIEEKCDGMHLDSGPQRHDAHRLYLNHGLKIVCHHFGLDVRSSHV